MHSRFETLVAELQTEVGKTPARNAVEEKISNASADLNTDGEKVCPDENGTMRVRDKCGNTWFISLPKWLMDDWTAAAARTSGKHLGILRMWDSKDPETNMPYMSLFLPSERDPTVHEEFQLNVIKEISNTEFATGDVGEKKDETDTNPKRTILAGQIQGNIVIRPHFNATEGHRMRERAIVAASFARRTKMIGVGGETKRLLTNANQRTDSFSALVKSRERKVDRNVRLPEHDLFNILFALFNEKPFMTSQEIEVVSQQPRVYLKEVLTKIAKQHKSGPHSGFWELLPSYNVHSTFQGDVTAKEDEEDDMERILFYNYVADGSDYTESMMF